MLLHAGTNLGVYNYSCAVVLMSLSSVCTILCFHVMHCMFFLLLAVQCPCLVLSALLTLPDLIQSCLVDDLSPVVCTNIILNSVMNCDL